MDDVDMIRGCCCCLGCEREVGGGRGRGRDEEGPRRRASDARGRDAEAKRDD